MSAAVPARQYDAHGKLIRTAELWVSRAKLHDKPTGDVTLVVTVGARQINLAVTPDNWYALNQAAWGAT